jgi:hypothetical protein
MKNREEVRQNLKRHNNDVSQEGGKYHFWKWERGINIVFGSKYRHLH